MVTEDSVSSKGESFVRFVTPIQPTCKGAVPPVSLHSLNNQASSACLHTTHHLNSSLDDPAYTLYWLTLARIPSKNQHLSPLPLSNKCSHALTTTYTLLTLTTQYFIDSWSVQELRRFPKFNCVFHMERSQQKTKF